MIEAFDADVLIYAASRDPRGVNIRRTMRDSERSLGSLVLVPEVLGKPMRLGDIAEVESLTDLLGRLDLKPVDSEIADAAAALSAAYGLRAADAIHLATAVVHGAHRFHTGNRKDFGRRIEEIEVVFP